MQGKEETVNAYLQRSKGNFSEEGTCNPDVKRAIGAYQKHGEETFCTYRQRFSVRIKLRIVNRLDFIQLSKKSLIYKKDMKDADVLTTLQSFSKWLPVTNSELAGVFYPETSIY